VQTNAFPDPQTFDYREWVTIGNYIYLSQDIISFGAPLTVENLREAYSNGIFPWHTDGMPLPWHCPERRAILDFADLRVPRSLEKARRSSQLKFTIDQSFSEVMRGCAAAPRPGQSGTWITDEFERVFTDLHKEGMAHSVEVWSADGELVGGLYGVDAGGVFCGESMFYKVPNASKLALLFLIDYLRCRGSTWLDSQVITPHFAVLGAKEIERDEFLIKLKQTQAAGRVLFP